MGQGRPGRTREPHRRWGTGVPVSFSRRKKTKLEWNQEKSWLLQDKMQMKQRKIRKRRDFAQENWRFVRNTAEIWGGFTCGVKAHEPLNLEDERARTNVWKDMEVSQNRGTRYLQIIHIFHRVVHYRPSSYWGTLFIWKPPDEAWWIPWNPWWLKLFISEKGMCFSQGKKDIRSRQRRRNCAFDPHVIRVHELISNHWGATMFNPC